MSPHMNDCDEGLNGDSTANGRGLGVSYNHGQDPTPAPAPAPAPAGAPAGALNGIRHSINKSPFLLPTDSEAVHDLVCVGFGPASLAVAVAIHDALSSGRQLRSNEQRPKVLFLEKQPRFAWHAGMLLPGAKMQISFLKDLATLRDPRSEFTFLNYLHKGGRLVDFTNLGTFLPSRVEYEDYLRWCASFFEDVVHYNHEVSSVSPDASGGGAVKTFTVSCRNVKSGTPSTFRARNVLLAVGGQPRLPKLLSLDHPRIIHSSQYAHLMPRILTKRDAPYRVAVVGAGQSAAEIFSNIQTLYPNSRTNLVMRSEFLRPSDDSPFINSIFNPSYIDQLHPKPTKYRESLLTEARSTNYGVVRLELIEHLYERMYDQRRELGVDETKWPHRIMGGRVIANMEANGATPDGELSLRVCHLNGPGDGSEEVLNVDLIIAATGYQRNAHIDMLKDAWDMLPASAANGKAHGIDGWQVTSGGEDSSAKTLEVGRDYRVKFQSGTVQPGSGVWLQGCCEGTHGISDTLLSVLATRSEEIVNSIFGGQGSQEEEQQEHGQGQKQEHERGQEQQQQQQQERPCSVDGMCSVIV